jgi:hypothetical protein
MEKQGKTMCSGGFVLVIVGLVVRNIKRAK